MRGWGAREGKRRKGERERSRNDTSSSSSPLLVLIVMLNVLGGEGREREVLLYRSPSVFFKLLFSSLPPQWIVAVECIEGVGPQFRPPLFLRLLFSSEKFFPFSLFPTGITRSQMKAGERTREARRVEKTSFVLI